MSSSSVRSLPARAVLLLTGIILWSTAMFVLAKITSRLGPHYAWPLVVAAAVVGVVVCGAVFGALTECSRRGLLCAALLPLAVLIAGEHYWYRSELRHAAQAKREAALQEHPDKAALITQLPLEGIGSQPADWTTWGRWILDAAAKVLITLLVLSLLPLAAPRTEVSG